MARRKILFICMGNICRSPAAEGVMKHLVEKRGLTDQFEIDSAGTIGYHSGEKADRRMRRTALERGYELTSISRQITPRDLQEFDFVLCADRDNLFHVTALDRDGRYKDKIALIMDYGSDKSVREVPDPYYGGPDGFHTVLDLLEDACNGLLDHLTTGSSK